VSRASPALDLLTSGVEDREYTDAKRLAVGGRTVLIDAKNGCPAAPGRQRPGYVSNEKPGEPGSGDMGSSKISCFTTRRGLDLPYWQLFYHVVWATRYRERLLGPEIEPFAHGLIRGKAVELEAVVFALNGMDDHVHLVVSIPPKLAPATFIGKVKGASSARLSQSGRLDQLFYWQEEYAVFSLDAKRLPHHVAYVDNQKIHHARATVIPALERTGEDQKPL